MGKRPTGRGNPPEGEFEIASDGAHSSMQFRVAGHPLRSSVFGSWLLGAIVVFCVSGCGGKGEVVRYEGVPKTRPDGEMVLPAEPGAAQAAPVASRMVVGIVPGDRETWFFKIVGPPEVIAREEAQWRPFLASLSLGDDGQPDWELPESWSVKMSNSAFRFATIAMDNLEMAVSKLGGQQDLLSNANRWLGQVGQSPIDQAALDELIQRVENPHMEVLLFDAEGQYQGMGGAAMGTPRGTPGGGTARKLPPGPVGSSAPGSASESSELGFDAPRGWTQGATSSMVPVRFTVGEGDSLVTLTVSRLPADVNDWGPNVQRWCGQVGLQPLSEAEVEQQTQSVSAGSVPGQRIRLQGPGERGDCLIAAMFKSGSSAWFVKMTGPAEAVEREEAIFDEFVKSLKF